MNYDLSHEELTRQLYYDPVQGTFIWKISKRKTKKGQIAGRKHPKGYIQITINDHTYMAHRLAWLYVYKSWPTKQIDHINENKKNNRINNLRDISQTNNQFNQSNPQKNNTSGYRGVSLHKLSGLYRVQVMCKRKQYHIGYFKNIEEAYKAYLEARSIYATFI